MDTNCPVQFHRGDNCRFDQAKHVERGFSGDDAKKKFNRHSIYQRYFGKIDKKYQDLRAFDSAVENVWLAFQQNTVLSTMEIVYMLAITLSDDVVPKRKEFFDKLCDDSRFRGFIVVRIKAGFAPTNVEQLVEQVCLQVRTKAPDSNCDGNLAALWRYWRTTALAQGIVIVVDDLLSISPRVLEDFLIALASYKALGLPFAIIAGLPEWTPPNIVLPQTVLRKYSLKIVNVNMENVAKSLLAFLWTSDDLAIRFTPRTFGLLVSAVIERNMSCDELVFVLKMMILEHFRSKPDSVYCVPSEELIGEAVRRASVSEDKSKTPRRISTRSCGQPSPKSQRDHDDPTVSKGPACVVSLHRAMKIDEYRRGYSAAHKIIRELYRIDSESTSEQDIFPRMCLESNSFTDAIGVIDKLDVDKMGEFIRFSERVLDQQDGVLWSQGVLQFRHDISKIEQEQWQNVKNDQMDDGEEDDINEIVKPSPRPLQVKPSPFRSTKLAQILDQIEKESMAKRSPTVSVLEMKRKHLKIALKKFLAHTLVSPSDDAISMMFFDDHDWLQCILSPSPRRILSSALSSHELDFPYQIYDDSGMKLDLALWFEEFKGTTRRDFRKTTAAEEALFVARFYKILSSLEFVGFITKGSVKNYVRKLCWTKT